MTAAKKKREAPKKRAPKRDAFAKQCAAGEQLSIVVLRDALNLEGSPLHGAHSVGLPYQIVDMAYVVAFARAAGFYLEAGGPPDAMDFVLSQVEFGRGVFRETLALAEETDHVDSQEATR